MRAWARMTAEDLHWRPWPVLIAIFAASCHVVTADGEKAKAAAAVSRVRALYNAQDFATILAESSQVMRREVPARVVLDSLRQSRQKFGAFRGVTAEDVTVVMGTPIAVRAVYHSQYDSGPVTEVFDFVNEGGPQRLTVFKIFTGTIPFPKPQSGSSQTRP